MEIGQIKHIHQFVGTIPVSRAYGSSLWNYNYNTYIVRLLCLLHGENSVYSLETTEHNTVIDKQKKTTTKKHRSVWAGFRCGVMPSKTGTCGYRLISNPACSYLYIYCDK